MNNDNDTILVLHQRLEEAAMTTPIDTGRLRAAVLRTAGQTATRSKRRLSPLAAAAAVAAIALAAGTISGDDNQTPQDGPQLGSTYALVAGPVDGAWGCAHQATYTRGLSDPSILPGSFETNFVGSSDILPPLPPSEMANAEGRYEYRIEGDRGELRYGTPDGSKTAVSQVVRGKDRTWRFTSRTLCAGPDGSPATATRNPRRLQVRPTSPAAPDDITTGADQEAADRLAGEVIVIDTRSYYDQVGRLRNITLRAYPLSECSSKSETCIGVSRAVDGDEPTSTSEGSTEYVDAPKRPGVGRAPGVSPLSCNRYLDTLYTSPTENDLTLCEATVAAGLTVSEARLVDAGGDAHAMQVFHGEGWDGSYLAVLVDGSTASGSVTFTDGTTQPISQ